MRFGFSVQGMSLYADFLVSDEVEEIMLGIDWLSENHCKWHFSEKQTEICGRTVPLRSRPSICAIRRVRLKEDVCVPPPRTEANVPVKITWNSWRAPSAVWLVVSCGLCRHAVMLPHTKFRRNRTIGQRVMDKKANFKMAAAAILNSKNFSFW